MKKRPSINLIGLFLTAIFLTLLVSTNQVTAETLLFQSPIPEEEQPTESAPSTEEPALTEEVPIIEEPAPTEVIDQPVETVEPARLLEEPAPEDLESLPELIVPTIPPRDEPVEESSGQNLIFDRAEFVDTILVFISWFWLCCGFGALLMVPLLLLVLQIRGGSKLRRAKKRNKEAKG
ncbi:hypothetical protein QUF63_15890 [Anaerolineales bacterium HSG25]|nr:hypothetical protein [Anaerolineales bacterium HSG25]